MKPVQIVGAGGIGCAVGYALRLAGVPIEFIEMNPAKIESLIVGSSWGHA